MMRRSIFVSLVLLLVSPWCAADQAFLGERTISKYWLENSSFLVVTPSKAFDTKNGCDVNTAAIIPYSDPHFKYVMAIVMQAMSTNQVIQIYAVDCYTAWGQKFPRLVNIGLAGAP